MLYSNLMNSSGTLKGVLTTLPRGVARQFVIATNPRFLARPVWLLDTGLWVCACDRAVGSRGKSPWCEHIVEAKEGNRA